MKAKRPADSRTILSQVMQPSDANVRGNVHGGVIMKLVDTAGAIAAIKHAGRPVVTAVMDSMTFRAPVYVGHLVTLEAEVTWVGRTSIETEVKVTAENVLTGEKTLTSTAYVVYVALDENGRPTEVPRLILETEAEKRRWAEAEERRRRRLEQRERERSAAVRS